ncbi:MULTISPECIES: TetR/AcrR family transcriptional regulator [Lacticaseibacillus]|uniref:TetR/AcrR family transcriptional regulator n=1 Tax=Lacticaseibacillus TaxID=2759736 RepID=UPI000F7A7BEF|nr:TetR/AcrR family transcriptional regulator [Lacticaseibacillus suibinensis]
MPKPTFFRLADEKRQRLIKAAYAEFARVPFQTASISNIIRDAGIPRGSFYQYFEDKTDIFFYLLDQTRMQTTLLYEQALKRHNGDLFAALDEFFNAAADVLIEGPDAEFYANVFLYMDFQSATHFSPSDAKPPHKKELLRTTLSLIDRDKLVVSSDEEVGMLFRQAMWIFMQSLGHYYHRLRNGEQISLAQLKARMATMLHWLQFGAGVQKEDLHD